MLFRSRYRTDGGDINAALRLVHSLACTGDFDESLPIRRALVDRGVPGAVDELAATLVELGRSREAYRLARFGVDADGCIENSPVHPLSWPCRTMIQRSTHPRHAYRSLRLCTGETRNLRRLRAREPGPWR